MTNKKRQINLYNLVVNLGFERIDKDNFIIFKNGEEILVYPKTDLEDHHFITTRHQLNMNGWMSDYDFDVNFKIHKSYGNYK
ncbi:hypothetical protein M0Q97_08195 [Candidatus Dojkabacteria bacterium]|jgi:hypothetical protein|nr:hypothetical protein [Candidatus Dojkabacteria bacterium]